MLIGATAGILLSRILSRKQSWGWQIKNELQGEPNKKIDTSWGEHDGLAASRQQVNKNTSIDATQHRHFSFVIYFTSATPIALYITYGFLRHDTLVDFIDETKERVTPQKCYNSLNDIKSDRATVYRGRRWKFIDTVDSCTHSQRFFFFGWPERERRGR